MYFRLYSPSAWKPTFVIVVLSSASVDRAVHTFVHACTTAWRPLLTCVVSNPDPSAIFIRGRVERVWQHTAPFSVPRPNKSVANQIAESYTNTLVMQSRLPRCHSELLQKRYPRPRPDSASVVQSPDPPVNLHLSYLSG